jgi:hypothetical protein
MLNAGQWLFVVLRNRLAMHLVMCIDYWDEMDIATQVQTNEYACRWLLLDTV